MLVPMTILAMVAVFIGISAARSIVAEADAHRLRGADAWWAPVCSACGGALNPFMTHCGPARHRQRIANVLVLIGTPVLLVAPVFAVPSLWIWPAAAGALVPRRIVQARDSFGPAGKNVIRPRRS